jgi:hypothetical protein
LGGKFKGNIKWKELNFELGNGCPNCGWGNNERHCVQAKSQHS